MPSRNVPSVECLSLSHPLLPTLPLLPLLQTLPVTIYAIKPFGVFVEFEIPASEVATSDAAAAGTAGGAPPPQRDPLKGVGLVHASQLSWDRVPDPSLCVEVRWGPGGLQRSAAFVAAGRCGSASGR